MENIVEVTGTQVAEFDEFEADLASYKLRYEGVVYDLAVPEQETQAKSDRLAIGKVISRLDSAHKEAKAPHKKLCDLIDTERKRIKDGLLQLQTDIKGQIAEHEAKIKAAADELLRRASVFRDLREFEFSPTIDQVRERLDTINEMVIDDSYGDQKAFAALNKEESLQILVPMLAGLKAMAKEEEEAERARLEEAEIARKANEERIRAEATELAEKAAKEAADKAAAEAAAAIAGAELQRRQALELEDAAKAKAEEDAREAIRAQCALAEKEKQLQKRYKAATLKAEQDAKAAKEKAKRDQAEALARAEAEAKRKAEELERQRIAAIEKEQAETAKREANTTHRKKINNTILQQLINTMALCESDKDRALAIIKAIVKDEITNTSIVY